MGSGRKGMETDYCRSQSAPLAHNQRLRPTPIPLRGVANDKAHHPTWQHDLKVVSMLQLGDNEGQ